MIAEFLIDVRLFDFIFYDDAPVPLSPHDNIFTARLIEHGQLHTTHFHSTDSNVIISLRLFRSGNHHKIDPAWRSGLTAYSHGCKD